MPFSKIPARDPRGRTVWVTRSRPKIDRIACPWLIRRFVDPAAVFLYVARAEVAAVAERFNAASFDIDNAFFGHRGELCTFDVMVSEFSLLNSFPVAAGDHCSRRRHGPARPMPRSAGPARSIARPVTDVR